MVEVTRDDYTKAARKRAASKKFQRLCEKSREWQNKIDAARHQARLAHAVGSSPRYGK